jgi:hypothetical protein
MFFSLHLENQSGDRICMTDIANKYMTSNVTGLSPPTGTINTAVYAGMDGSYLNNAFIEKRNIVISFEMRGMNVEERRHQLYKVVKPSRYVKVYYRTAGIDVYAEGYVETCDVTNFGQLVSGQISIICPDIYWYSNNPVYAVYSQINGAFHFPFPESDKPFPIGTYGNTQDIVIENSGEKTGFLIRIEALDDAVTPTIYNADTGEYLQITGELLKGDVITISTKTGHKTVTLTRNGVDSNIINRLVTGSTWLQLSEGRNTFHITAGKNIKNLKITIIHRNAYLGV